MKVFCAAVSPLSPLCVSCFAQVKVCSAKGCPAWTDRQQNPVSMRPTGVGGHSCVGSTSKTSGFLDEITSLEAALIPQALLTLSSNQLGFTSFPVSLGRRFDPALQFLLKKVQDSRALGRIHRISTISSLYPAASLSLLKASGTQQVPAEESGLHSESWDGLGGKGPLSSSVPPPTMGRDTLTKPD